MVVVPWKSMKPERVDACGSWDSCCDDGCFVVAGWLNFDGQSGKHPNDVDYTDVVLLLEWYIYIINTCCGHNDNMIIPILFYFGFFGGWDERVICNFNRLVVHGEARKLLQGGCKYLGISLQKMDTEATTLGCFVKN